MGCGLDSLSGTLTSSESPDITRAQSCFLLKALSSRWASPRVVTYTNSNHIVKCTCMPQQNTLM